MPKGPQGQKGSADMVAAADTVAKIAAVEIREKLKEPSGSVCSGKASAAARAEKLNQQERSAVVKKAAAGSWG